MGLTVRSPSCLEKISRYILILLLLFQSWSLSRTYSLFCMYLHPGLSAVPGRRALTHHWKYKVTMVLEQWFTILLQGLCYFFSTESCFCVTSLRLLLFYFSYRPSPLCILTHLYLRLLVMPTLTLAARGKLASLQHRLCTHHGKPISSSCPINPASLCRLFRACFFFLLRLGKERRGRLDWWHHAI